MSTSLNTCLSPGVYQLVCVEGVGCSPVRETSSDKCGVTSDKCGVTSDKCGVTSDKCSTTFDKDDVTTDEGKLYITEDGLLDWIAIKKLVPDLKDMGYRDSVRKLSLIFRSAMEHMETFSVEEFIKHYEQYFVWTGNSETCIRCFEILRGDCKSSTLLSLLMSSAILERALGDVYLLKGKQCPSLLKDLLLTSELSQILGHSVVEFLRVLIGSPASLNLRNLVWHGFPNPDEIHKQYGYMLIIVILSISEILIDYAGSTSIKHRTPVTLHKTEIISQQITGKFPLFSCEDFLHLCSESDFILPQFVSVWKDAFDLFTEHRYGESVCLLFPVIENGLRLMFAQLNNCPHRVLTAESSVLYTTFDEILARQLPDGGENKLLAQIGRPLYAVLQDIMVMPEGPRFRDRLGHGEVKFEDITETQASAVWMTAVGLVYKFISPCSKSSVLKDDVLVNFIEKLKEYYSVFHPVSLLVNQVVSLSSSASSWLCHLHYTSELLKIEPGVTWCEVWADNSSYQTLHKHCQQIMPHFLSPLSGCLTNLDHNFFSPEHPLPSIMTELPGCDRITSLRRSLTYSGHTNTTWMADIPVENDGCTMEAVSLLRKIMIECEQISENIVQALSTRQQQLEAKQLRSRQRDTLKRLITSVPCMSIGIKAVILSTLSHLLIPQGQFTLRFLKSMLQYCENVRTFTSLDKNKWYESIEFTRTFLEKLSESC